MIMTKYKKKQVANTSVVYRKRFFKKKINY